MLKGCKTFEVGSGVSSPPILHPPWCFITVVGWICHSLPETEGENDLEKPSQGYTKITFLAVVVLEAQPLPAGVLFEELLPCTCPLLGLFLKQWDRTVEWEDTCSDNLMPFFMDKINSLEARQLSVWVLQSSLNGSGPVQVLLWVLTLRWAQAIPLWYP